MKRILKGTLNYYSFFLAIFLLAFLAGCNGVTGPELKTLTIQPNQNEGNDSMVIEEYPRTNYGDSAVLQIGKKHEKTVRTYLKFDLSVLPYGAHVVNADLKLYQHQTSGNENYSITVHTVTESWSEEAITWNNQPSYSENVESTVYVIPGTEIWLSWDIRFLVDDWVTGYMNNYGVVLKDDDSQGSTFITCWSSEWGYEPELRPKLVITYSLPS